MPGEMWNYLNFHIDLFFVYTHFKMKMLLALTEIMMNVIEIFIANAYRYRFHSHHQKNAMRIVCATVKLHLIMCLKALTINLSLFQLPFEN